MKRRPLGLPGFAPQGSGQAAPSTGDLESCSRDAKSCRRVNGQSKSVESDMMEEQRRSNQPPSTARRWIVHPLWLSILSGVMYALAFPAVHAGPLAWIALVPLIGALRQVRGWRWALLCGATAAVAMCAIGYAWIADMAMRFWKVPLPVAMLLLLVYSSFGEINFTLFALLLYRLRSFLARQPAAATAVLFTGIEALVPKIFPDTLGATQVRMPALPAAASLVGTFGLTFLLSWFGACVAWLPGSGRRKRQRLGELVLCLAGVGAFWLYGVFRARAVDALPVERTLDVAIIQSNIGDMGVFLDELGDMRVMADTVVSDYVEMTRRAVAAGKPDVVIWPETAIPVTPRDPAFEPIRTLVRELDVPLVFGAYDFQTTERGIWLIYNTLYWMDAQGRIRAHYYKHNLLPLGEHVPFSERFPILLDWIPDAGEFSPGPGAKALDVDGLRFTPLICYEILFPRYVRRGVALGGDVLLNLTNDYWFGKYAEPEQHLSLARMRAFETGRPIVRATNTGISALIAADGRVLLHSGLWQPEIVRGTLEIPVAQATPYLRAGEWMLVALMLTAWGLATLQWRLMR